MVNNLRSLDGTFAALADATRRAILARLARGGATVTELAQPFDISLPAVSKHLRVLEEAGLVVRERHGRVHRIRANAAPMKQAVEWIERYRRFWEARLDALAEYLDSTQEERSWPGRKPGRKSRSASSARSTRRGKRSSARGPSRRR